MLLAHLQTAGESIELRPYCCYIYISVCIRQVLRVALVTNNAVIADGANITVAGVRVTVTALSGYSAPHTGTSRLYSPRIVHRVIRCIKVAKQWPTL